MPGHHRIDQRQDRLRQIGQNDGKRQHHHPAVPVFLHIYRLQATHNLPGHAREDSALV